MSIANEVGALEGSDFFRYTQTKSQKPTNISKIIRFLGGKELEEDHRVSDFATVTFLRQLLSISDVNYCQFLFFYFKQEYASLHLLKKYTKIMDHILSLHIRSN